MNKSLRGLLCLALLLGALGPNLPRPMAAAPLAPMESGVYEEDFSSYAAKDYAEDSSWDMWSGSLKLALSDGIEQYTPAIAVDSEGRSIVVWENNYGIYAQYLDAAGNQLWQSDLRVSNQGSIDSRNPDVEIAPNDAVYIVWGDQRDGDYDIYAQKIDINGNRLWMSDVQVNSDVGTENQWNPVVEADNAGNVFVAWEGEGDYGGIYIQKLDSSGNKIWSDAIRLVEFGNNDPDLAVDQWGNAVVVWWNISDTSIFAQRLSPSGNKLWADDIQVSELFSSNWPKQPTVAVDSGGNAFVAWNDYDIYVQWLSTNGSKAWPNNVRITSGTSSCWNPSIAVGTSGQAVVTWDTWNSIYAQKIDQYGNKTWTNSIRVQRNQHLTDRGSSSVAVDEQGHILIAWWERGNSDIYTQKLGTDGLWLWGADVRTNAGSGTAIQRGNVVVTALDNSFFVVWHDSRNGKADLYVQRLASNGTQLWESDVRVNGVLGAVHEEMNYTAFGAALDANGYLVVVWGDARTDTGDIYAQRIDANGNRQWINDVRINSEVGSNGQSGPDVATDKTGNAIVVWRDFRNGNWDIYAQKIDGNANKLWTLDVGVNDASDAIQSSPSVAVDSTGNTIIAWDDRRNKPYNSDIYAQMLSPNGARLWTSDVKVNGDSDAWESAVTTDSSGNAILVWQDYTISYELYAQKLSPTGAKLWGAGVIVNSQSGWAESPSMCIDSEGNACIVWWGGGIYVQRLSPSGTRLWANDLRVNSNLDASVYTWRASVGIDDQGTMLIAWADDRNANDDIHLQKVTTSAQKIWIDDLQLVSPDFFYLPNGLAQSRTINTLTAGITQATLTADMQLNGGSVQFYVTNDSGATWAAVTPGVTLVFTTTGSDLRWRAELTGDPLWRRRTPVVNSLRIEYSTGVPNGDDYEPDDTCAQVSPIQVNGATQQHDFHQYEDSDWVWFDAQAGITYVIQTSNTASRVDTVLELYATCGAPPVDEDDNAFGPGATLAFTAPASGRYYARVLQNDGTVYGAETEYDLSVRAQTPTGAAIIVAGRMKLNDEVQPIINATANLAYQTLLQSGFSPDNIQYLNSDTTQPGVDATPTLTNTREAIQNWARTRVGLGVPLWLYLADHGEVDRFHNEVSEVVTAAELNLWLSNLEATSGVDQINVVIDACFSGSFIDTYQSGGWGAEEIAGHGRVVVASTTSHWWAYAPPIVTGQPVPLMYFSDGFWHALAQGQNVWGAFLEGREAVEGGGQRCGDYAYTCQRPWLDDTGDAWFDTNDGLLAQSRGLQANFGGGVVPYIDWVQVGEVVDGQAQVTAQVRDDGSVGRVWMRVFAPSFTPPQSADGSVPVVVVPEADLGTKGGDQFTLNYTDFTETGVYQMVVYAIDDEGNVAQPKWVLVGGKKIYLPLVLRGN